jgi:hypothetical protein
MTRRERNTRRSTGAHSKPARNHGRKCHATGTRKKKKIREREREEKEEEEEESKVSYSRQWLMAEQPRV